jgi:hypothetical protein
VAGAEPTLVGRLVAAWPPLALLLAYELLMQQVRATSRPDRERHQPLSADPNTLSTSSGPLTAGDTAETDQTKGEPPWA